MGGKGNDERELPPLHVQFDYVLRARVKTSPSRCLASYIRIFRARYVELCATDARSRKTQKLRVLCKRAAIFQPCTLATAFRTGKVVFDWEELRIIRCRIIQARLEFLDLPLWTTSR